MLHISYPYDPRTREPRPLNARQIWQLAQSVRDRFLPRRRTYRIDHAALIRCCSNAVVNFLPMTIQIHLDRAIADDHGRRVLGATGTCADLPGTVVVSVSGDLIGDRDYLLRSTLAHELAHAVFDGPAMLLQSGVLRRTITTDGETHLGNAGRRRGPVDWREYRANEFMGALLVPGVLLQQEMVRRAIGLGIPLVDAGDPLPVIGSAVSFDRMEHLLIDLAERFGVSPDFIACRLRRYALVQTDSAAARSAA